VSAATADVGRGVDGRSEPAPPVETVSSWGNVVHAPHACFSLSSRSGPFPQIAPASTILPYGNGRSYGDSCLNPGAALLKMRGLDRFIRFDPQAGILACEAGVLLADVLQLTVPAGWFVPVTPGTRFVTVGGMIANDVHGKNHHRTGTIGRHIRRFELMRSDGRRIMCSQQENPEWFAATVGGLGLTGVISWAELSLRPIAGPLLEVETIRFANLEEFLALSAESDQSSEYTVAWVDCLGRGKQLGRGLLQRANHSSAQPPAPAPARSLSVPLVPPFSLVNPASLRLFNTVYYHRQSSKRSSSLMHYESFFYPLDSILNWNRLYGPRGLYQYQCVIPAAAGAGPTAALLECIARRGLGSFLAVLKQFGPLDSPGMLSFPRAGVTLALDFPNRGVRLERLFAELDTIVLSAGGRLYPAKDGRMPGELFRAGYPLWPEFSRFVDPLCSSGFWRRVMEGA
jgi:FAD/FMN-containing dehydrogenase